MTHSRLTPFAADLLYTLLTHFLDCFYVSCFIILIALIHFDDLRLVLLYTLLNIDMLLHRRYDFVSLFNLHMLAD